MTAKTRRICTFAIFSQSIVRLIFSISLSVPLDPCAEHILIFPLVGPTIVDGLMFAPSAIHYAHTVCPDPLWCSRYPVRTGSPDSGLFYPFVDDPHSRPYCSQNMFIESAERAGPCHESNFILTIPLFFLPALVTPRWLPLILPRTCQARPTCSRNETLQRAIRQTTRLN